MTEITITAFELAVRFVGVKETAGAVHNPQIVAMLRLDDPSIWTDETPWCSAFTNYIAWLLRLPRSKSLAARSWLNVGTPMPVRSAEPRFDVVILNRDHGPDDPRMAGPGHVGFFAGFDSAREQVYVLGGNQGDAVSLAYFPAERILGVRRLLV